MGTLTSSHLCLWSHLALLFLFPMSHAVGTHHPAVARDETKHDFVWQPVPGTALIHGNPAVSGELEGEELLQGREEEQRDKKRGTMTAGWRK